MAFVNVMRREEPNSRLQKRQKGDNNNNAGNLPPNNNPTLPKNNNGGISKGAIFGLFAAALVVIVLIVIIIRRKMVRDRTRNMEKINDTEWNPQRLREDYNEQGAEKYTPLMVVRHSPLNSPRFPNSASPRLPYDSFDSPLGPPSPSYSIQNKSSAESLQPLIKYSPTNSPHLSPHSPVFPPNSYGGPKSPKFLHFPSSPQRSYRSPPHSPRSLEDPPRSPKDQTIQQDNFKKPLPSFPPETNVDVSQENQNLEVANLSRDIKESDKINVPDTSSTLATTDTHYAEHNESQSESENTVEKTLVANPNRNSPDSPQLMQLPAMEFIEPTQSNMVIDNESYNIINNSIPPVDTSKAQPQPSPSVVTSETQPKMVQPSPSVDTSKAQPKMVQPSQSNMKIEKVDRPKISAPIIIGTSKPEIIAPAPAPAPESSKPVSPLYDIDVIKRHAEKVKNLKASVVAKKVDETENNEKVIKENHENKESSNEGGQIKRKKSVRFKADLTNQEEIPEDSASKSIHINKDDYVNLQEPTKEPIIQQPTSSQHDDDDRNSSTSGEYQMYDFDISSYQDNSGVPEILAKTKLRT